MWLITSDLHINDWTEFSKIDRGTGVPSRLMDYYSLAEDIKKLADERSVTSIIIAGDVSHKPIQRPRVLKVIRDFFSIISQGRKVYCIVGQHDLDTKSSNVLNAYNCIIHALLEVPNVDTILGQEGRTIDGKSVLFRSWNPNVYSLEDINSDEFDVFVSHGLVRGSRDSFEHVFKSGFNPGDLGEKFKLSIIGDIHKGQIIDVAEGRKVLIPGPPFQFNWKDDPDCGIYLYDPRSESLEFFSTESLRPNYYHRFLFSDEKTGNDRIHVRRKTPAKIQQESKPRSDKSPISVEDAILECIKSSRLEDKDLALQYVKEVLSGDTVESKRAAKSLDITRLEVKNFLSIRYLDLDFSDLTGIVSVIGANGSGKTSLFEAIFFAITGSLTKSLRVTQIKCDTADESEDCYVKVCLTSGIEIIRGRKGSSPYLELRNNNVDISGASVSETQKAIEELVGEKDIIFLLCYFSSTSSLLFGDLQPAQKYDFLANMFDLSCIDDIRNSLNSLLKSINEKSSRLYGEMENTKKTISMMKKNLESFQDYDFSKLESELAQINSQLQDSEYDKIETLEPMKRKLARVKEEQLKVERELDRQWEIVEKARKLGVCATCNQKLPENSEVKKKALMLVDEYEGKLQEIKKAILVFEREISILENLKTYYEELEDKKRKILSTIESGTKSKSNIVEMVNTLEADLYSMQSAASDLEKRKQVLDFLVKSLSKKTGPVVLTMFRDILKSVNQYLASVCDSYSFSVKVMDDLSIESKFDNKWRGIEYLSNGQRRITNIALIVALHNLYCDTFHVKDGILGTVVLDESISFIDEQYKEEVKSLISKLSSKRIFIVSQDPQVASFGDRRIDVSFSSETGSTYHAA